MASIYKAYVNTRGKPALYLVTHDVRRGIADSKKNLGWVNVTVSHPAMGIVLLSHDEILKTAYLESVLGRIPEGIKGSREYLLANQVGRVCGAAFQNGSLLLHPQFDFFAVDFDNKPGRREILVTVLGESAAAAPAAKNLPPPEEDYEDEDF